MELERPLGEEEDPQILSCGRGGNGRGLAWKMGQDMALLRPVSAHAEEPPAGHWL